MFRIEPKLTCPGQHLTQLPREGAGPGSGPDFLRPGLFPLSLQQVAEPLFLFWGPEQPQVLPGIAQLPQQAERETVDSCHPGANLGTAVPADDVPPEFLRGLP